MVTMTTNPSPLSALILGIPNPVSMGIARGWQMAGNRIASIWFPERLEKTFVFAQDRDLAAKAPGLTLTGLRDKAGVHTRAVPRLRDWSGSLAVARSLKPDVIISLLFPDRIPETLTRAFPGRIVNLHPSLLPAYRGPYPVLNMLWDETINKHSGFTLHLVSPEFDLGDIIAQRRVPFPATRNVSAYYMELVKAGAGLLTEELSGYFSGTISAVPQEPTAVAPQGKRSPRHAILTSDLSAARMHWLCATVPQVTRLVIDGLPDRVAAIGFLSEEGAPTGAPPHLAGDTVSMDAADARVRLRVSST
jgi:methionyl-tRNA formyltransferase